MMKFKISDRLTMSNSLLVFALMLILAGCSKADYEPNGVASLNIVNAIVGSSPLITNFKGTEPIVYYRTAAKLNYGIGNVFARAAGSIDLGLYTSPDTLSESNPYLLFNFDLPRASIHTLFLAGTKEAPESVLVKESLPHYVLTDSVMNMRFINLSPNSPEITINLKGADLGSEAKGLAYKEKTAYQRYPVKPNLANYVLEFRNKETGALLASYTAAGIGNFGTQVFNKNTWIYKNFTLAFIGKIGGAGADIPKVVLVTQ